MNSELIVDVIPSLCTQDSYPLICSRISPQYLSTLPHSYQHTNTLWFLLFGRIINELIQLLLTPTSLSYHPIPLLSFTTELLHSPTWIAFLIVCINFHVGKSHGNVQSLSYSTQHRYLLQLITPFALIHSLPLSYKPFAHSQISSHLIGRSSSVPFACHSSSPHLWISQFAWNQSWTFAPLLLCSFPWWSHRSF